MKIAAFNTKRLGLSKVNDEFVLKHLVKIVSRYSVVVLLEVVGQGGRAMDKLLRELNRPGWNRQHQYAMKSSVFLGRSSYREQFVFFYREDEVQLIDSFQYEEAEDGDVLAREPFICWFNCPGTVVQDLVLIPVHTKPEHAEMELNALDDVVQDVRRGWRTDNIVILGDFNADGRYFRESRRPSVRIGSSPYSWLIDDDVDTTTSYSNDNTYDRIVVYGDVMFNAVVPNSAKPFNFQRAYRLRDEDAERISDHYPVEAELRDN